MQHMHLGRKERRSWRWISRVQHQDEVWGFHDLLRIRLPREPMEGRRQVHAVQGPGAAPPEKCNINQEWVGTHKENKSEFSQKSWQNSQRC